MFAEGCVYRERHNIPPLQSEMVQLAHGTNNLHVTSSDSGNSYHQSIAVNDGRVSTPPLFNNRRDNSNNNTQNVKPVGKSESVHCVVGVS